MVIRLGSAKIRRKARHRGIDYSYLFMRPDGRQPSEIARLVEAGVIRPVIDQAFPFTEAPAALDRSASGRA
ncbi:zinc-binding dehydrogenase [Novosphingobium tardum]|uniref:Zinc-binding dehydrogenase n=1 Tax=Novosphingobium tardum TaxID=1538021 RepID=A0ABV8RSP6_9SPHN